MPDPRKRKKPHGSRPAVPLAHDLARQKRQSTSRMSTMLLESTTNTATESASQVFVSVPLETLGRDIVARVVTGDKVKDKADQMYMSAGLQLIVARSRVHDFQAFLRDHCGGLSRSRAYELIAIAEGNAEEVRSKNRTRDR